MYGKSETNTVLKHKCKKNIQDLYAEKLRTLMEEIKRVLKQMERHNVTVLKGSTL